MKTQKTSNSFTAIAGADQLETEAIVIFFVNNFIFFVLYIYFSFLLEYSCFTMLCQRLLLFARQFASLSNFSPVFYIYIYFRVEFLFIIKNKKAQPCRGPVSPGGASSVQWSRGLGKGGLATDSRSDARTREMTTLSLCE